MDELPPEGRTLLDGLLADITYTYDAITDEMQRKGYDISRSSISRYALRQNAVAKRLQAAREQTTALLQVARDNKDIEATELATSILIDGLTQKIATAEEEFEAMPLEKAGKLLVQLQRSAVYKARMRATRAQACRDVEAAIMADMRNEIQNDPDLLDRIAAITAAAADREARRHADDE